MFRMPATVWTADLNTAPQDSMLWVFQGLTVYLADVLRTGGRNSLDDFTRSFFGIREGSLVAAPYTFDDLVAALDAVTPYDRASFLRAHVDSVGMPADLEGVTRGCYKLAWTDQSASDQQAREDKSGGADNLAWRTSLPASGTHTRGARTVG